MMHEYLCGARWFASMPPRRNILFPQAVKAGQTFKLGAPHLIKGGRRISFCVKASVVVVLRILFRERDNVRNHINRDCPSTGRTQDCRSASRSKYTVRSQADSGSARTHWEACLVRGTHHSPEFA